MNKGITKDGRLNVTINQLLHFKEGSNDLLSFPKHKLHATLRYKILLSLPKTLKVTFKRKAVVTDSFTDSVQVD